VGFFDATKKCEMEQESLNHLQVKMKINIQKARIETKETIQIK